MSSSPRTNARPFSLASTRSILLSVLGTAAISFCAGSALADHHEADETKAESAVEVSDSFRKAMFRYFEVQGSFANIGESVSYGMANEMLVAIQNSGTTVTEEMQNIVLEESLDTFGKRFGDLEFLTDIWAPVYAKHFSEAEVKEMTKFFESPVGKKSLDLLGTINQEGMTAIQQESFSMAPEFQLGVDARFREAGITGTQAPTPAP